MAPYSMDLRKRVLADRDAGIPSKEVAAKFRVSLAWVNRLTQRRRESGEVKPRQQTVFKKPAFAGHEDRLRALVAAKPDQTLAELRDGMASAVSLSTVWRALDRLDLTLKKNRTRRRTATAGHRR
jgi:transposase